MLKLSFDAGFPIGRACCRHPPHRAGLPVRALSQETFSQVVNGGGNALVTQLSIQDAPSFVHRGLMIDTGRRFWPVPAVQTMIDAVSYVKGNVIHLHASDFCRVAIQSETYPALTSALTGDYAGFYTHADVQGLVEYGADRGVRIVPEFDLPGHAKGMNPAEADGLGFCSSSQPKIQLYDDPAGKTRGVLGGLLGEMSPLFPDELLHIGADETSVRGRCPLNNTAGLERWAVAEVTGRLGKTVVGWEEILFDTHAADNRTVVNAWSRYSAADVVKAGYRAIESAAGHFYLNHVSTPYQGMWRDVAAGLSGADVAMVLGGEVSMWTDDTCIVEQCGAFGSSTPVGSHLFPPAMDVPFSVAMQGIVWPRAAVAFGSFWGFDSSVNVTSEAFTDRYRLVGDRLQDRSVQSCPDSCSCDYTQRCGQSFVPCAETVAGTNVVTSTCRAPGAPGGGAQAMQWTFGSDGRVSLQSNASLCLGLVGSDPTSKQPSAGLVACPAPGTAPPASASWSVKGPKIINADQGHCLDITGSASSPGSNVEIYPCGPDSQTNQEWTVDAKTGYVTAGLDGLCLAACSAT